MLIKPGECKKIVFTSNEELKEIVSIGKRVFPDLVSNRSEGCSMLSGEVHFYKIGSKESPMKIEVTSMTTHCSRISKQELMDEICKQPVLEME